MKTNYASALLFGSALFLFACKNDPTTEKVEQTLDDAADKVEQTVDHTVEKVKEQMDENFVSKAWKDNAKELEWLRVGSKMGTDPELVDIAKKMIPDHESLSDEIKAYAVSKHIEIDADTSKGVKIDSKTGLLWDEEWADKIRDMHRDRIDNFERTQSKAEDAALKDLATKVLPILRTHLNLVEKLEARLSRHK